MPVMSRFCRCLPPERRNLSPTRDPTRPNEAPPRGCFASLRFHPRRATHDPCPTEGGAGTGCPEQHGLERKRGAGDQPPVVPVRGRARRLRARPGVAVHSAPSPRRPGRVVNGGRWRGWPPRWRGWWRGCVEDLTWCFPVNGGDGGVCVCYTCEAEGGVRAGCVSPCARTRELPDSYKGLEGVFSQVRPSPKPLHHPSPNPSTRGQTPPPSAEPQVSPSTWNIRANARMTAAPRLTSRNGEIRMTDTTTADVAFDRAVMRNSRRRAYMWRDAGAAFRCGGCACGSRCTSRWLCPGSGMLATGTAGIAPVRRRARSWTTT